ncbi:MAG TPA: hypothetical protein DFS52_28350, partial [Myxococcales bacterium]|nr:hypothetical protein [Myxococcales bacterium]
LDGVELNAQPTITFVPGPVSATTSTVVASPAIDVVADGVTTSTITITLLDAFSNPIPNTAVTLTKSSTVATMTTPAATSASGVTTATIKSIKAETVTITAKVGTSTTLPTATVTFVPDAPHADKSTVQVSRATGVIANNVDTSTITATIKDANSNLISGATVAFASSNANDTFTPPSATSGANGVATATIASTKAELKTITVTVNGTTLLAAAPTVTFVPGPPSASASSATAPADLIVADGVATSTITVTVRDDYANPIPGKKVVLTTTGTGYKFVQPANSGANGVTTGTINSTVAEKKTITATIDGTPAVVIDEKPEVTFVAGDINPASLFTVDRTTGVVANNVDVVTASVTVKDLEGNPVPGAQVVFAATGTGNTFDPATGTVTTLADGTASVTLASTKAEPKTISVTAGAVPLTTSRSVTFVAGPPTAADSEFTASPTSVLANGQAFMNLTVVLRDAYSNPVPSQAVNLKATGSFNVFTPSSGSTNTAGTFTATLKSNLAEQKRLLAETALFVLTTDVRFYSDAPVMVSITPGSGGGCLPIGYSVKQLQNKRVDVLVEFKPDASSPFRRATQAAGTSDGLYGITASSAGASHTFLWNTTADVPRGSITAGSLRITPSIDGLPGSSMTVGLSSISNRLSFSAATQLPSGTEPVALAMADLNRDGKLDLVTANPSGDQIIVHLGNANGSFMTAKPFIAGAAATLPIQPVAVAPVDYDGDGDLDLAAVNRFTSEVSIYVNDGSGTFTLPAVGARPSFTLPGVPRAVIAADVNRDFWTDLLVADATGLSVLLGSPSSFAAAVSYPAGVDPSALVVGDFDRDGNLDVAVANEGGDDATILLGDGQGAFASAGNVPADNGPSAIATGDFDADGILDLAIANRLSNNATVLLGAGDGSFVLSNHYKTGMDP